MRILHVISGLAFGGAERQLVIMSRQLVNRGHKVLIYTLNRQVPLAAELEGCGVELIVDQKRLKLDPLLISRIRRTAISWGAQLGHGWLYDGNIYTRIALRGLSIPVINSERSDNYRLTYLQRLGYALTRGWENALVANTHAGLAFATRLHKTRFEHGHVVWNGIDLKQIERETAAAPLLRSTFWPRDGNVFIACLVGSITAPKNHVLALETAAVLNKRDSRWRFLFVGGTSPSERAYAQRVRTHCQTLNLNHVCQFTDARTDAITCIAASDVLFSTSHLEGFPNVVLEAMACGTPVVSTAYSDIHLVLPKPWQIVKQRSPTHLADAMEQAILGREQLSIAQRAWVEKHATAERAATALEAIYGAYLARIPSKHPAAAPLPETT